MHGRNSWRFVLPWLKTARSVERWVTRRSHRAAKSVRFVLEIHLPLAIVDVRTSALKLSNEAKTRPAALLKCDLQTIGELVAQSFPLDGGLCT